VNLRGFATGGSSTTASAKVKFSAKR
jgi:hypothetical protein